MDVKFYVQQDAAEWEAASLSEATHVVLDWEESDLCVEMTKDEYLELAAHFRSGAKG